MRFSVSVLLAGFVALFLTASPAWADTVQSASRNSGVVSSPLDGYEHVRSQRRQQHLKRQAIREGLSNDTEDAPVATGLGLDMVTACNAGHATVSVRHADGQAPNTVLLAAFADQNKRVPVILKVLSPAKDGPSEYRFGHDFAMATLTFTLTAEGQDKTFEMKKAYDCY